MVDTARFGGRTVHCPVWIIAAVQPQLHGGVDVVWRHLHNIMKNATVFKGYNLKKGNIYIIPVSNKK